MARIVGGEQRDLLRHGWEMAEMPAGACIAPGDLPGDLAWLRACVPGTVAQCLSEAGLWSPADPAPLHDKDYWYRTTLRGHGAAALRFEGLATIATVWLDGREILASTNMFHRHEVALTLAGAHDLHICFHALAPVLAMKRAPGRWRPRMMTSSALRHVRTTTLGHMPGWCPPVHTVGPWRHIALVRHGTRHVSRADLRASLAGSTGVLEAEIEMAGAPVGDASLMCAGLSVPLTRTPAGTWSGRMEIADVEPWWPHTHGEPTLHRVSARFGDAVIELGRCGFRRIEVDRGDDGEGFGIVVNGVPVFCRGAVWASADLVGQPEHGDAVRPWIERVRDAGFNMLRVAGTTVYESQSFYELCDELGVLVWQDFMFANFDYPSGDETFATSVEREASQFLDRIQTSPSLAVLCGGSEVYQQAAMLGLPARKYVNPLFEELLPRLARAWRPDVPYVVNSPSGGALPFVVNAGVGHYWGVGGYRRPLGDARRAGVRFAAECLALANVPSQSASTSGGRADIASVPDPRWKRGVARDIGASWDFEDVRDHYLEDIFGVRAADLRATDPERYLSLSRATQAEVMERAYSEWMRRGSTTRGALVLMLQDLQPGAGWGLLTCDGRPKSCWHALRRICQPIALTVTDEGVNGLDIHLANDTSSERRVSLELVALRQGQLPILKARRDLSLAPRSRDTIAAFDLMGRFFDITYAYRFQAAEHDTVVVRLADSASGKLLGEAIAFPHGHRAAQPEARLAVELRDDADGWYLAITAERLARFVHIVDDAFLPDDDWFHLAPGRTHIVRLAPRLPSVKPSGTVRALNLATPLPYRAAS